MKIRKYKIDASVYSPNVKQNHIWNNNTRQNNKTADEK
jgi:hypothetical protein